MHLFHVRGVSLPFEGKGGRRLNSLVLKITLWTNKCKATFFSEDELTLGKKHC